MAKNSRPFVERDDLMLLMESYRNTIQLSTTLLEKQNVLIEKQNNLTELHRDVIRSLKEVSDNLRIHTEKVIESEHNLETLIKESTNSIKTKIYVTFGVVFTAIATIVGTVAMFIK